MRGSPIINLHSLIGLLNIILMKSSVVCFAQLDILQVWEILHQSISPMIMKLLTQLLSIKNQTDLLLMTK